MRRRDLGTRRFAIIVVLVASMMATLLARLGYVQLLDPHKPHQTAGVCTPARSWSLPRAV